MKKSKMFTKMVHAVTVLFALATHVSASGLQESVFYTGTAQLISDAMLAATILCPIFCGLAAVIFATRRGMADEQDGKMWTKRLYIAVICGVVGPLVTGIIALVASYYA